MKTTSPKSSSGKKSSRQKKLPRLLPAISNPRRLMLVTAAGLVLTAFCFMQGLSIALTRKASEISMAMPFANGMASEARAATLLAKKAKGSFDLADRAERYAPLARAAFAEEALVPKAHSILAMASQNADDKSKIINAAALANRRDLLLSGLILEQQLDNNDYQAAITTFDRILRVHPDQSNKLFPSLLDALYKEETLPEFAKLLNGTAPWHNSFLNFAVNTGDIRPNLAKLRFIGNVGDENFDKKLILGLTQIGEIETAHNLFKLASKKRKNATLWVSDYPPFDWRLEDSSGKRAFAEENSDEMEISVRSGKAGIIAERWIPAPKSGFQVIIDHKIGPVDQIRDVQFQASCANKSADTPFYSGRFAKDKLRFRVTNVPGGDCAYIRLAIHARSWSGRSALRGTMSAFKVTALN